MDGSLMCARYAFMPNKLKYCGPDRNRTLFEYVTNDLIDQGLVDILSEFKAAYPYLTLIAHANGLADPLDVRVVEAYWLGNKLLNNVSAKQFTDFIRERFSVYLSPAQLSTLLDKVGRGGKPHHNFHVYHVFLLTGGMTKLVEITLPTINNCRISWGKVLRVVDNLTLQVESDQVVVDQRGRFGLKPAIKEVSFQLDNKSFLDLSSPPNTIASYVSIHWGWVCGKINQGQVSNLGQFDRRWLTCL